ncbi:peptide deformylase [Patescibacteria group bacterium]
MPVLKIKKYPDPILRKKAKEVSKITKEVKDLSWDMIETMEANDGAGLAAPQVGRSKRIIAVNTKTGPEIFINPVILNKSRAKDVVEEGCLSVPEIRLEMKRAKEVEIRALGVNSKETRMKAKGLTARIIQHEIDHLDGHLIIDKVNPLQKWLIKRRLKKLKSKKPLKL